MTRVFFITSLLAFCIAICMLPSLLLSFYYADGATKGFATSIIATSILSLIFAYPCRKESKSLSQQRALLTVGLCWVITCVVGALPFVFSGQLHFTDALFESVSGFTTTGASIFPNVEIVPKSLIFWRSCSHWLGGMGIVVLSLAIFSLLGVGGMQLYKAEVSGYTPDRLAPTLRETAALLWQVYLAMTLVLFALLWIGGMNWFDAINHTFATVATGGFSTRNASLAAFPSPFIQWTIIIFMFLSGINFALHLRFLRGDFSCFRKNEECRMYTYIVLFAIICISLNLWLKGILPGKDFFEWEEIIRVTAFQVVSVITTTGFASTDYSLWPSFALGILLFIAFIGGSAGSTAGGFKVMRLQILTSFTLIENFRFLHPRLIRPIKLNNQTVTPTIITAILSYFLIFLALLIISTLILLACSLDLETAFTASLACIANVGPGLGEVGPVNNYGHLPYLAKWVLTLAMLLGRLEVYAVFAIFMPSLWRGK